MFSHIISDFDFDKEKILAVFSQAKKIQDLYLANWNAENKSNRKRLKECLFGKTIVWLGYEPSTRTRTSFEKAAKMLGADVIICDDMKNTSAAKGESLEDTIRTFQALGADAIVMRHPESKAPQNALKALGSDNSHPVIINAGDGKNFHPTQALLDLYTLWRNFGEKFTNGELVAGICGDLNGARTIHSLALGLKLFNIPMICVGPKNNNLPQQTEDLICWSKTGYIKTSDLSRWAGIPDFWYFCRLQTERYKDSISEEELKKLEKDYIKNFGCTNEFRKLVKPDAVLMHPGPALAEFPEETKKDPRSLVKKQVENGVWIRAALLKMILNPEFDFLI